MSTPDTRVVIVGAGHAGGAAAALLRQYGHAGEIVLIGREPVVPYQRPPLSKAYLKGEADAESLKLKPDSFYAEQGVDLRLETNATAVDRDRRRVEIENGGSVEYGALILATGSRARKLSIPGAELAGVHEMRTLADADDFKAAVKPGHRLAIIGGGYIGLEAAASARALGAEAVIIERESRCLARVACGPLADFFEAYHRARGVEIVTGASVEAFEAGLQGRVGAVRLSSGRRIECDSVLVGVGGQAADELAREAGLPCENGVVVDGNARTEDPAVFAIGDVTWRPMPVYGERRFRLESVPNALEQAKQAAAAITGRPPPPAEVPWFWSDQYDLKLQIAGVAFETDAQVLRGDPGSARFAVFHLLDGRVQAVEAVNSPPEFMMGRQLIANRKPVDPARLADSAVSMKDVA